MSTTRLIQEIISLPAIPRIAQKILALGKDDTADMASMAKLIEQDPGLTAKILGIANSALYVSEERVFTLNTAIVKLGFKRVTNLALGIILAKQFSAKTCPPFRLDQFWYDAMVVSLLATKLARTCQVQCADDVAHLCGLLHHIGMLALVHVAPQQMATVFKTYAQENETRPLVIIERNEMGLDHCDAGGALCEHWELPVETGITARHHLNAHYSHARSDLVSLIRFCVHWKNNDFEPLPASQYPVLHLDPQTLAKLARSIKDELEGITNFAKSF